MTKKLATFAICLLAITYSASAQSTAYKLDVGDFSELKVTDGINVVYKCSTDSAGWAFFNCDPKTAQMLMFTNKKNALNIQVASDGEKVVNLPTVTVCSMTLQKVENSGDSTLSVERTVPVREFSTTVVGNGSIIVSNIQTHKLDGAIKTGNGHLFINGSTRAATLKNVGTGTIEASGLKAEEAKCTVLGTGAIDCNASISLSINGAGSGKVYYGGSPEKITNRSIGVKAVSIDDKE